MNEEMTGSDNGRHFECPFCHAFDVDRLYIASLNVDACQCAACGEKWDEDSATGRFRGRAARESVFLRGRDQ